MRGEGPQIPLNIEWWLGSFVSIQGNRTSIAKKPYSFVIFRMGGGGGRGQDTMYPLWIRAWKPLVQGTMDLRILPVK